MLSRCKEIDVDAAAGLVLWRDVCDQRGAVLLQKDTVLTESLLQSLRRRGIDSVPVRDEEVDETALAAERERVGVRLRHLNRHGGAGRADAMLRNGLLAWRLEALQ